MRRMIVSGTVSQARHLRIAGFLFTGYLWISLEFQPVILMAVSGHRHHLAW